MKSYVSPALDSDEPLDPIEQAIVRLLVKLVVKEIRAEDAAGDRDDKGDSHP